MCILVKSIRQWYGLMIMQILLVEHHLALLPTYPSKNAIIICQFCLKWDIESMEWVGESIELDLYDSIWRSIIYLINNFLRYHLASSSMACCINCVLSRCNLKFYFYRRNPTPHPWIHKNKFKKKENHTKEQKTTLLISLVRC